MNSRLLLTLAGWFASIGGVLLALTLIWEPLLRRMVRRHRVATQRDLTNCTAVEGALRASEACLRQQFDLSPIPTFIWKATGAGFELIQVNAAARTLTLGKVDVFLGMTADQLYADRPDLIERFDACFKQQTAIIFETPYRARSTGLDRVIIFTFAHVSPDLVLLYTEDITERRRLETDLHTKQANLLALIENTDDYIWSVDRDYRLIIGNSRFQQDVKTSLSRELAIGENVLGRDEAGAMNTEWRAYYDRALRGESFGIEVARRLAPPPEWKEYRFGPIRDQGGAITGVTIFGRSLSARRRAESELRESEERFRLAFENANDGVCLVGLDGRLLRVNTRMCEILGYSRQTVEGATVNDFTHPDFQDVSPRFIHRAIEMGHPREEFDKCYVHRDGHPVWARVSSSLIFNEHGAPLYFISHVQDITIRRQAEQERAELQARLAKAQRMESIGRLAGGIAHDFNNLLAVILMRTEISLLLANEGSSLQRNLLAIHAATHRSAELVHQLLGFARKQMIAPKVLDLNAALAAMLPVLRNLAGESIRVDWLPGDDLWRVRIDPSQLNQILTNLTFNARDAIAGQGTITIATQNSVMSTDDNELGATPGDYVALTVVDDGCGMSKEVVARIFEPFFTTKEVGKGTGLGLAMIDGVVQQNYGYIDVSSQPGQGATFRIYLPRVSAAAPATIAPNTSETKGPEPQEF